MVCSVLFWPRDEHVADVEEGDIEHEADEQHRTGRLHGLEHVHVDRLAPDAFDDGENDVSAIENRERQAD